MWIIHWGKDIFISTCYSVPNKFKEHMEGNNFSLTCFSWMRLIGWVEVGAINEDGENLATQMGGQVRLWCLIFLQVGSLIPSL